MYFIHLCPFEAVGQESPGEAEDKIETEADRGEEASEAAPIWNHASEFFYIILQ